MLVTRATDTWMMYVDWLTSAVAFDRSLHANPIPYWLLWDLTDLGSCLLIGCITLLAAQRNGLGNNVDRKSAIIKVISDKLGYCGQSVVI